MKTHKGFVMIKGYEGLYAIHRDGRVYSYPKGGSNTKGKFLNPCITKNGDGYLCVGLTKRNIRKSKKLHRLLMETFIPNYENKKQINHLDGNKLNNSLSNLEWATAKENFHHARNNGLRDPHGRYKCLLSDKQATQVKKDYKNGIPRMELSKKFKVPLYVIYNIVSRRSYKWIKEPS